MPILDEITTAAMMQVNDPQLGRCTVQHRYRWFLLGGGENFVRRDAVGDLADTDACAHCAGWTADSSKCSNYCRTS